VARRGERQVDECQPCSSPSTTAIPSRCGPRTRKFFDAYLSGDNRVTLLDVIPSDTVSLTGLMDVVRAGAGHRGHSIGVSAARRFWSRASPASNVDTQHQLMRQFPKTVAWSSHHRLHAVLGVPLLLVP